MSLERLPLLQYPSYKIIWPWFSCNSYRLSCSHLAPRKCLSCSHLAPHTQAARASVQTYKKGDVMVSQGDKSDQVCTLHSTPYTLRPAPCTFHPAPYTRHPAPDTLHPTPYTLHPTPSTLHPNSYTLHPKLYTPMRFVREPTHQTAGYKGIS